MSAGSSEDHGSSGCSSSPPESLEGVARYTSSAILEEELVLLALYVFTEVEHSPPGPPHFLFVDGKCG